jgi:hypothetical protein
MPRRLPWGVYLTIVVAVTFAGPPAYFSIADAIDPPFWSDGPLLSWTVFPCLGLPFGCLAAGGLYLITKTWRTRVDQKDDTPTATP